MMQETMSRAKDALSSVYSIVGLTVIAVGLIVWAVQSKAQLDQVDQRVKDLRTYIDHIDQAGSRAIQPIQQRLNISDEHEADLGKRVQSLEQNYNQITREVDRIGERQQANMRRLEAVEKTKP